MRTEQELLELFKDSNIEGFKLEERFETTNSEESFETTSSMKLMCIEDIIKFSCRNNINAMFYYYSFASQELLVIDDEVISEFRLEPAAKLLLQDKFDEHNERVSELDFSKPLFLYVYIIHQGVVIFATEQDFWFFEEGICLPKDVCAKIVSDNMEDIKAQREDVKEKVFKDREVLRQQILNDEEFHQCTNTPLRRAYAKKIFSNRDNKMLFIRSTGGGGYYDVMPNEFIEIMWKEYKTNLRLL